MLITLSTDIIVSDKIYRHIRKNGDLVRVYLGGIGDRFLKISNAFPIYDSESENGYGGYFLQLKSVRGDELDKILSEIEYVEPDIDIDDTGEPTDEEVVQVLNELPDDSKMH